MVVNDRVDVCLAAGADGVHVGVDDMPVAVARAILGPQRIVGATAKTPHQVSSSQQHHGNRAYGLGGAGWGSAHAKPVPGVDRLGHTLGACA